MKGTRLFVIFLLLSISSCAVKKRKISKGDSQSESPFACDERQYLEHMLKQNQSLSSQHGTFESDFIDIPLPLDTVRIASSLQESAGDDQSQDDNAHSGDQCIYCSSLERSFLGTFFTQQMEIFGWQMEGSVSLFEDILIFSKLHKKAFISLRTASSGAMKKSRTTIVISVCTP